MDLLNQWILVGAGGHAKAIVEGIQAEGRPPSGYVDRHECSWLKGVTRFTDDATVAEKSPTIAMGLGGQTPKQLQHRLKLLQFYLEREASAPPIIHPTAIVSASANLSSGTIVLAGAIIQPGTHIGTGVIVNTAAIVEHDCRVGPGSHIGPGAVVLGGALIGDCSMIGAKSVILSGAKIASGAIIKAGDIYRNSTQ